MVSRRKAMNWSLRCLILFIAAGTVWWIPMQSRQRRREYEWELRRYAYKLKDNPQDDAALAKLVEALQDDDEETQAAGLLYLSIAGNAAIPALDEVLLKLESQNYLIVRNAVRVLSSMKADARPQLPRLIQLSKKPNSLAVRVESVYAIGRIATTEDTLAVEALEDALAEEELISEEAKLALRRIARGASGGEVEIQ